MIKIAVVDDERMLLNVFSSLMKQFNYDAHFFSHPVSALNAIMLHPDRYRLVITDIRMPELNGIEFAKKVREVAPKMPILFMTGDATDETRDAAQKMGNTGFLEKPFPLEQTLKEVIPALLAEQKPL